MTAALVEEPSGAGPIRDVWRDVIAAAAEPGVYRQRQRQRRRRR